jgi:Family of unknown function (DUF5329)
MNGHAFAGSLVRLVVVLLMLPMLAQARDVAVSARQEIDALLARLGRSSCEFYRNGSWHGAAQAQAHLNKKFQYLNQHHKARSAEEFIALGATKSSISGQSYLVRCNGQKPVLSATWLTRELELLRSTAALQPAKVK